MIYISLFILFGICFNFEITFKLNWAGFFVTAAESVFIFDLYCSRGVLHSLALSGALGSNLIEDVL